MDREKKPRIDIFAFSLKAFDDTTKQPLPNSDHIYHEIRVGNGKDILANLLVSGNFHSSSCAMIIRSDLIDWKKEGFLNILHEDEEITPRLFLSSSSIYITNKVYYNYRKHRDGSIMSSSSIGKFFRSRWGYLVSLLSCQRLLLENLSDKRLRFALITRSRYLSRHAFIPVLGAVKKLFLKKGF